MARYLDSSALVKLVVPETESDALRTFLGSGESSIASSALARTEVVRAVRRGGPAAILGARSLLDDIAEIVLSRSLLDAAAVLLHDELVRALDAIHLASAALLGADLDVLVTYDHRMAHAAESLGMPVASPA